MGTASESTFTPNASHGEFWNGYMVDFSLYKLLAIFPLTGLLGLDQLVLRSPITAFLKFVVNILFYGAWYFYDMIQVMVDQTSVAKYGMSTPYGPRGHGYRLFANVTESNLEEYKQASPYYGGSFAVFLYLIYVLLSPFSFTGLPAILAGDFSGGITKLFSNFFFLPFLFYLIAVPFEIYKSTSLEKTGIPRTWPLSPWFMLQETHPAVNLLGKEQGEKELKNYTTTLEARVADKENPILIDLATKGVEKAYEGITTFPPVAAFTTATAAKGAVLAASDVGQSLAKAVQKRVASDPDAIIDGLLGAAKSAAPVPVPVPGSAPMKGGGFAPTAELDKMLLAAIAVLGIGGFAVAVFRKFPFPKRSSDDLPQRTYGRDDAPPQPGGI